MVCQHIIETWAASPQSRVLAYLWKKSDGTLDPRKLLADDIAEGKILTRDQPFFEATSSENSHKDLWVICKKGTVSSSVPAARLPGSDQRVTTPSDVHMTYLPPGAMRSDTPPPALDFGAETNASFKEHLSLMIKYDQGREKGDTLRSHAADLCMVGGNNEHEGCQNTQSGVSPFPDKCGACTQKLSRPRVHGGAWCSEHTPENPCFWKKHGGGVKLMATHNTPGSNFAQYCGFHKHRGMTRIRNTLWFMPSV